MLHDRILWVGNYNREISKNKPNDGEKYQVASAGRDSEQERLLCLSAEINLPSRLYLLPSGSLSLVEPGLISLKDPGPRGLY